MEQQIQSLFDDLEGEDKDKQYSAFMSIMEKVESEVNWAYEVWDMLLAWLKDKDNHRRARAAQFLAGLAISDPEQRILRDFPLALGSDEGRKIRDGPTRSSIDLESRFSGAGTKGIGDGASRQ